VGGDGGPCVLKDNPATGGGKKGKKGEYEEEDEFAMTDAEMDEMVQGQQGQAATLQLMLRTVADVGFVGFPNAGKSTLLAALTRAAPEVAPFPFTTLMPNLGALADDTKTNGAEGSRPAVLADLPGLIEGASYGRGLGRQFLRHLRRVQVVLYVLDTTSDTKAGEAGEVSEGEVGEAGEIGEGEATAGVGANGTAWPTAIEQYEALRRELYLYNPDYLARPHIVALNKLDLPLQRGGQPAFDEARARLTQQIATSAAAAASLPDGATAPPIAIVPLSGLRGKGIKIMKVAISRALAASEARPEAAPKG